MEERRAELTNCDIEPIHIPGKVQSHGFLVAIDTHSRLIRYVSENISKLTCGNAGLLLGRDLEELSAQLDLNAAGKHFLFNQLINADFGSSCIENLNPYFIEVRDQPFNVILSFSGDFVLMEFEPKTSEDSDRQRAIGTSVSKILAGGNKQTLLRNTAQEVRKIIAYDRVMIYQFGDDGHGQVIAEDKREDLPSFLGLHYPASDIPKQARELYKINLSRIIADVHSEPSSIIASRGSSPLDLTSSELRAVSPLHIQYLKNMGVEASFSISLLSAGELWGLIACHNLSPKFINYNFRDSTKLIGQIFSSAFAFHQGDEDRLKFEKLSQSLTRLIDSIANSTDVFEAITRNEFTVKDIISAGGAALIEGSAISIMGQTPDLPEIAELAKWLFSTMQEPVFTTHQLPRIFPPALDYSVSASGIIACILSKELKEILIWFKPERLQAIDWAGRPEKATDQGAGQLMTLTPRRSFEMWTEMVKNSSENWDRAEIAAVITLREHIIYTIKRKASEARLLNEKILKAYDELDSFSYTVSHDLKAPLTSIRSYAELLLTGNSSIDDHARNILDRICKCADRMAGLIAEILEHSRVGRAGLITSRIDMGLLITEIWNELSNLPEAGKVEFETGRTPDIDGDRSMIRQVFTNLLHNALKYSARSNPPKVRIEGKLVGGEMIYSIADNGIGIDMNHYDKVFELFKRMDNAQNYEGTGVGLAIVKRIVERHGARIWFESKIGVGTIFYIAFNVVT